MFSQFHPILISRDLYQVPLDLLLEIRETLIVQFIQTLDILENCENLWVYLGTGLQQEN
jgi:hypothetical protein